MKSKIVVPSSLMGVSLMILALGNALVFGEFNEPGRITSMTPGQYHHSLKSGKVNQHIYLQSKDVSSPNKAEANTNTTNPDAVEALRTQYQLGPEGGWYTEEIPADSPGMYSIDFAWGGGRADVTVGNTRYDITFEGAIVDANGKKVGTRTEKDGKTILTVNGQSYEVHMLEFKEGVVVYDYPAKGYLVKIGDTKTSPKKTPGSKPEVLTDPAALKGEQIVGVGKTASTKEGSIHFTTKSGKIVEITYEQAAKMLDERGDAKLAYSVLKAVSMTDGMAGSYPVYSKSAIASFVKLLNSPELLKGMNEIAQKDTQYGSIGKVAAEYVAQRLKEVSKPEVLTDPAALKGEKIVGVGLTASTKQGSIQFTTGSGKTVELTYEQAAKVLDERNDAKLAYSVLKTVSMTDAMAGSNPVYSKNAIASFVKLLKNADLLKAIGKIAEKDTQYGSIGKATSEIVTQRLNELKNSGNTTPSGDDDKGTGVTPGDDKHKDHGMMPFQERMRKFFEHMRGFFERMMDFFAGMFGGHGESRHSWGHSRHHDQGSTSSDAVKPKPPFIFGSHRN